MKLIFIYGPPASGKFTIAREISQQTGFKLFHNHATVDLVAKFFEFGTKSFWDLLHAVRLDIFEATSADKIEGMIFTYVYEKGVDDKFVKKVIDVIEKNKGKIIFVHVSCDQKELLERVGDKSRFQFQKIKTRESLTEILNRNDFTSAISFVENIEVNTTNQSIAESVGQIMKHV